MNVFARPGRALAVGLGLVGLLGVVCCGGAVAAYVYNVARKEAISAQSQNQMNTNMSCGGQVVNAAMKLPSINSLSQEQIHNAAVIISVGQQMKVPPRGWVIAIATAMQESTLHNYGNLGAHNDHDSLGLFQQRPSQGWGTPAQVMDPVYASHKFYERLLQVAGWQNLPLTVAAQRVQRSAFPDAYAKHEPLATVVVNTLTNGAARAVGALVTLQCPTQRQIAASGWTNPVPGAHLTSGFRTPSRPTHNGDDLAIAKGTPILAASAGLVTLAKCDAATAGSAPLGCDQDGGLNVSGCGWYVEILHAGNVITRYCHMLRQPMVQVGQMVTAGQQIGVVGDSGHSSGPHCHFEVHLNGDRSFSGAVDPTPFMRDKGVTLGA
ncbi:MAG TPA: M23 family metallopeptidase [Rugosimonospora sp.]|nr:M23 family metallopeptidase [Rugosimonospora sp.]